MDNAINEFIDAIRAHGAEIQDRNEIIADDTIRRAHMVGDRQGKTSISYQLAVDADGFACGWFVCYKISPESVSWHSKAPRGKAKDYRERARVWINSEEQRAKKEADRRERNEEAVAQTRALLDASATAAGHGYLVNKNVTWAELRQAEGAVLVPIVGADGELMGCQRIYRSGVKSFIPGSEKKGGFYEVSLPDDDWSRVFIAEGLSTALTVRRVSESPVFVAFDCGNMKPVAQAVRKKYPNAVIIMAADNDLWTIDANGKKVNPGMRDAAQAAFAVDGLVWAPEGLEEPYTDWNDAANLYGDAWVRERLDAIPMPQEEEVTVEAVPDNARSPLQMLEDMVNPLGYEDDVYYFLPRNKGQIASFAATGLASPANLFQMGTPDQYRAIAGDPELKQSDIAQLFMPMLITMGNEKGVYNPDRVYGAGAWRDGGEVVVNTGADVYLAKDGTRMAHSEVKLNGVVVKERKCYTLQAPPLSNREAHKLFRICSMLNWSKNIDATLLAGWLVIAPVGGALRWRPHVFITGQKGAGKSTVIEQIVGPVLGETYIRMDGGSTEAGLRKLVRNSSRPVVMDEFEAENKRDTENTERILTWARKASSGGIMSNANDTYRAQSAICFAAINPRIMHGADKDRITTLELEVNKSPTSEQDYARLLDMIYETLTPEYSDGLIRRTVDNIDALLANCETFSKYASRILKSKRAGDQVGPMLAGAYMLHSTGKISDDAAAEWCDKQDWQWANEQDDGTDSEKLMRRILNSLIEYTAHDRTQRMPVSELIGRILSGSPDEKECRASLGRIGIRVEGNELWVSNSDDQLSKLLEGTPWVAYRNSMMRYPGAMAAGKSARFGAGSPSRYMTIPLDGLLADSTEEYEEVEAWDD